MFWLKQMMKYITLRNVLHYRPLFYADATKTNHDLLFIENSSNKHHRLFFSPSFRLRKYARVRANRVFLFLSESVLWWNVFRFRPKCFSFLRSLTLVAKTPILFVLISKYPWNLFKFFIKRKFLSFCSFFLHFICWFTFLTEKAVQTRIFKRIWLQKCILFISTWLRGNCFRSNFSTAKILFSLLFTNLFSINHKTTPVSINLRHTNLPNCFFISGPKFNRFGFLRILKKWPKIIRPNEKCGLKFE